MDETISPGVPERWEDVTPGWMTAALSRDHPGARVSDVELVLRDDGTNRRARFALTYSAGRGPETVFVKAESDVPGRREIHASNGNLFNEAFLYRSGIELPVEHPFAYLAIADEAKLDYVIVMEDLAARRATARHALSPLTPEQAANGLSGLARLHSRFWGEVGNEARLNWVQPFLPMPGLLRPMRKVANIGLARAADVLPGELSELTGDTLVDTLWAGYLGTLTTGPQTLLHGDPHIGNTYTLADQGVGFLDWQVVRSGSWAHDVGYFLQSALVEEDRRRCEADLVEEYRSSLDVPETERPSPREAWLRYRATPVHGLVMWIVTLLSDVHPPERSLELVRRYAASYVELETSDAIERLEAGQLPTDS